MKKEWEKPVMTVVAKSTPEENVLVTCKGWPEENRTFSGPGVAGGCWKDFHTHTICNAADLS